MDYELLKEMWEITEHGEMPKGFRSICESYYRRKCVFHSQPFDETDFAFCVMIYKLGESITAKMKKIGKQGGDKPEGDGE